MSFCKKADVLKWAVSFSELVQRNQFPEDSIDFAIKFADGLTKADLQPRFKISDINVNNPPELILQLCSIRAYKQLVISNHGNGKNTSAVLDRIEKMITIYLDQISKGLILDQNDIPLVPLDGGPSSKRVIESEHSLKQIYEHNTFRDRFHSRGIF